MSNVDFADHRAAAKDYFDRHGDVPIPPDYDFNHFEDNKPDPSPGAMLGFVILACIAVAAPWFGVGVFVGWMWL